jgi:hypothetical protein
MFDSSWRIKHDLSTKQMAVKRNQTWTFYNTNGSQDESNMNSLQNKWQSRGIKHELSTVLTAICFVDSSCLIPLDCHFSCREFMFDSSWLPFVLLRVHIWFALTAICFVESSCLFRLDCHLFCREFMFDKTNKTWNLYKEMVVQTNQTWTLYKRNGSQDESNMNSLQHRWLSRRIKHELSTKHLFCREFMFDSSWLPFLL